MSAEIVELAAKRKPPNPGNGACEALGEIFSVWTDDGPAKSLSRAEVFVIRLWMLGFKVIPLEDKDLIA